MDAIFIENASYYLLGYQATDMRQDGKQRRIEVRVNRPGVEVRARNGYVAEKPDAVAKRKADLASRPLGAALAGILPKSDLPLQLTAVPFAVPGKKEAGVAVILGVRQPIRDTGARTVEKVDLVVRAFDTNGKQFGATNLRADVTIRADASGLAEYEVLSRIDLKPGRYQLRTAANVGSLGTAGSLYYDVVVPDFMDAPLSLSALVLSSTGRADRRAARRIENAHSCRADDEAHLSSSRPGLGVSSHLSGRQQAAHRRSAADSASE